MVELTLKIKTGSVRMDFVDYTYEPKVATALTQSGDVMVL